MSLKMKLTSAIIMFMLAIATLVIGVLAAQTQSINMEGTINFEISDRSLYVKNVRLEDSDGTTTEITSFMPGYINDGITLSLGTHTVSNTSFKIHFDLINTTSNTYEAGDVTLSSELQSANVIASASGTISPTSETIPDGESYAPITSTTQISGTITLFINSPNTTSIDLSGITVAVDQYIRNYSEEGFEFSGEELIAYTGTASEVIIPSSYSINELGEFVEGADFQVTAIADGTQVGSGIWEGVFSDNLLISTVVLPSTLEKIGDGAFANSTITTLKVDDVENSNLSTIGRGAFRSCQILTSVEIPELVNTIGSDAFDGCYALAIVYNYSTISITAGQGDRTIGYVGQYAKEVVKNGQADGEIEFDNQVQYYVNDIDGDKIALAPSIAKNSITSITFAPDTTEINPNAFYFSSNLVSVDMENTQIHTIGSDAFCECHMLKNVTLPNSITTLSGAFWDTPLLSYDNIYEGGMYLGNSTNPYLVLMDTQDTNMTSFTIHSDCKIIYDSAFDGCTSLTTITIPETVTSIGKGAFQRCFNLQTVDFGTNSQLQTIGINAFQNCTSLTTITIPEKVTSIGEGAFQDCYALAIIYNYSGLTITAGGTDNGRVGQYAKEIITSSTPEEERGRVIIDNQVQYYVTGSTKIALAPAVARDTLTSVTLATDTTEINQYAFENCSNLQTADLSNSQITEIPDYAFNHCSSLTTITLPEGVTSIGEDAFSRCSSLTSITIPEIVTSIGEGAFQFCSNLQTLDLSNSRITSIPDFAFDGCSSLITITLPEGVTSIGEGAFASCSSLAEITISETVTSIGESAFRYCTNLVNIVIDGQPVYESATGVSWDICGGLLQHAQTVKVPTSIVNSYENSYLESSNFTPSTEMIGDVEYTVFTKVGA